MTPTPAPSATPGILAHTRGLRVDWSGAPESGFGGIYEFTAIATNGRRFVAVGDATWEAVAGVWISDDGIHWSDAAFPDAASSDVRDVAANERGFVVTSERDNWKSLLYFSADGVTWEPADTPQFVGDGVRYVAATSTAFATFTWDGRVLTSPDGLTWTVSMTPSAIAVGDGLQEVVSDGSSMWAFSHSDGTKDENRTLEAWTSSDGATWAFAGELPGSRGHYVEAAAVGPDAVVAIEYSIAWYSLDGTTWQQAEQPPDINEPHYAIADQSGFVVVGYYVEGDGCAYSEEQEVGVTWTSVDGNLWRKMPEKGFHGRVVQVLAVSGRNLLGLGTDYRATTDDGFVGMVWTARLPDLAEDRTAPSPAPTRKPSEGC